MTVIRAIVAAHDPAAVVTQIQPEADLIEGDAGPLGGGWKGVRRWCGNIAQQGGLDAAGAFAVAHTLVLHVDADIAPDREVNCACPCPPAGNTTAALCGVLLGWLGDTKPHESMAFCIPAQATELWVAAALDPATIAAMTAPECVADPAAMLFRRPEKFVRRKDGRWKKHPAAYRDAAPTVTARWAEVTQMLPEAMRFDEALRARLG